MEIFIKFSENNPSGDGTSSPLSKSIFKTMKKYLLITAFLLLGVTLSGCSNPSSSENTTKTDQEKKIDKQEIGQPKKQNESNKTTTSIQDESAKAVEVLVSFFAYLSNQNFEKALTLFELDDPANSWEGLENFSLPEDRNNKAKVLNNYCEATGTCLKAKIIETKKENDDTYNLVVQFQNTNGSIFVLGPCCGATEEEMPSRDKFDFKVKKINNLFKVTTAPVYRP